MNIRSSLFWAQDALLRRGIAVELADVMQRNSPPRRAQAADAASILAFAREHVPFYRRLRADSVGDLPVVDKTTISADPTQFEAASGQKASWHQASTSGSTGTPFRVFHDQARRRRVAAEAIYFGRLAGYDLGTPLFHLKIWSDRNTSHPLTSIARNVVPIDTARFDSREVEMLLTRLSSRRGQSSIIGYGSALEELARFVSANPQAAAHLYGRLGGIIGQSEPLSDAAREHLQAAFGVRPVGRYGLEELGIVAQQEISARGEYQVNLATHYVEILAMDSEHAAEPGDVGRIVVTDLRNRAQPMIRYDTGDVGVAAARDSVYPEAVTAIARLDGRSTDQLFDTRDRPLAPMIAYSFWWKFPALRQYQIEQTGRGQYVLRVDMQGPETRAQAVADELRAHVGPDAQIRLVRTEHGFVRSSGKRRSIITSYSPTGDDQR